MTCLFIVEERLCHRGSSGPVLGTLRPVARLLLLTRPCRPGFRAGRLGGTSASSRARSSCAQPAGVGGPGKAPVLLDALVPACAFEAESRGRSVACTVGPW